MKILITGANGMVARAATEYCRSIDDAVVALTRTELDIAARQAVVECLTKVRPDAVINCAAYTDVDGAESNQEACFAANAIGVENLAIGCGEIGAKLVIISTDYVFDGANPGFYTENDEPNPQGVYAESKYEGEKRAIAAKQSAIVVRSGWIYGSGGTNFLSLMHSLLADGKRIKAIRDAYGTPTFAGDLAKRLRDLAEAGRSGIFHAANSGEGTSYLGFAQEVCRLGGWDEGLIESVENADLKRPAPRPVSSKLASVREAEASLGPMPEWREALSRFLDHESKKAAEA